MSTSRVFALVSIMILICGCTKTVRQRVAEYQPGTVPTTQPVPATAVYSIRFVDASGKKFGGVSSSHVYLRKGEPIGFAFDENGKLRGIAGTYNFAINTPEKHGLVWSATFRRPTQFGREVEEIADASWDATRKIVFAAGVSAFFGFGLWGWWLEFWGK
jgi:hypothetical protein